MYKPLDFGVLFTLEFFGLMYIVGLVVFIQTFYASSKIPCAQFVLNFGSIFCVKRIMNFTILSVKVSVELIEYF
jgi:hypothetical protein